MRTANLAIVFSSIVGYGERVGGQSYEHSQRMLRLHEALALPVFGAFSGRRVKTIGGTFLAAFDSPTAAVRCAAAVQDRVHQWNERAAAPDRLHLRAGVNVGEVRLEKGDVFGEPVNIAARVEGQAQAGEVLFTEAVRLAMTRGEALPDEDLGYRELKGVPEQVRLWRLSRAAEGKPYGGLALAGVRKLPLPDPALLAGRSEVLAHLQAAAQHATSRLHDALPALADRARILAAAAIAAMLAVAAALLAPSAAERALSHAQPAPEARVPAPDAAARND